MKTLLLILTIFTFSLASNAQSSVADLGWIAGCWQIKEGDSVTDEQWMKPLGGMMLGVARSVLKGKVVNYEFTRLEVRDGAVYYVAKPSQNATETAFKLVKSAAGEVIFENLAHDFPQRIIYRRTGDTFGARRGNERRQDQRV